MVHSRASLRTSWKDKLSEGWHRLRGGELSPARFASSVALGLFIGCLPVYGGHFFLCAGIGLLLRLDVVVAYVAAHISIPPVIPFLLYGSVQLGHLLLSGKPAAVGLDYFRSHELGEIGAALAVGSVALGASLAVLGGLLSYGAARGFVRLKGQRQRSERWRMLADIVQRYRHVPRQHRHYVEFKLRLDPLTDELTQLMAERSDWGRALDVGCGRGQFSLLLAPQCSQIHGVDHDRAKVEAACLAAQGLDHVEFVVGDVREAKPSFMADTVLIFDVLHYLEMSDQLALLALLVANLAPGGWLLVRENNRGGGVRSALAAKFEVLARGLGINRGERLEFLAPGALSAHLRNLGLTVDSPSEASSGNVLLVARRPRVA